jgi:D-3-phosphoglycerate dehydrogenase / 2-oxoglutarate reductase
VQIGILEPKDFSQIALKNLSNIGCVKQYDNKNLDNFLSNKEILFVRLAYLVDENFLNKLKKIKYICTPTTGLNHIDIEECNKRKIKVISLKDEYDFLSTIRATPEHTFGLILSLIRNYKEAFLSNHNYHWDRERCKGFELYGSVVGIIGFGRVGKILSKYLNAFNAKIFFFDVDDSIKKTDIASKLSSVKELISRSDIVVMSASYNRDNDSFFDKEYIDLLRDKYFVNTSRGELINEDYLIKKIKENFFRGVALDVIQKEQEKNNLEELVGLTEKNNLIITPHISGATFNSMRKTEEFMVNKLLKNK